MNTEGASTLENRGASVVLKDDPGLLDRMLADSGKQPALYRPGPFWAAKARNAANEIRRVGIGSFRGSASQIGLSFADNLLIDARDVYNHGYRRVLRWLARTLPLSRLFEAQLRWTESHAKTSLVYAQEVLNLKPRTRDLLKRYVVPYSLLGDCADKATIDGKSYAKLYLCLLDRLDIIASRIDLRGVRTVFEIGGGFGANVHLLIENFPNIRKIIYLDIPPNLYIGTQYLKAFYGSAVIDYNESRPRDSIRFSHDDSLEIFCIAPWQIEIVATPIDLFMNSTSFVEMPRPVVANYAAKVGGLPNSNDAAVVVSTNDGFDLRLTIAPSDLPRFFQGREFQSFEVTTLVEPWAKHLYFLSPGRFGRPSSRTQSAASA
jgi:putative sugar O-methyltransferase